MFLIAGGGRLMNHVRRAAATPIFVTGTEDPIFPISRAYDHRCGSAAMFADTVEDSTVEVDKNVLVNGNFLVDPVEGWVLDPVGEDPGSLSAEGILFGRCHQDMPAVPGELWSIFLWIAPNEGSGPMLARVRNLHTGRYLKSDLTWSDTEVDFATTLTELNQERIFRVESFAECGSREVTLRLIFESAPSGGEIAEAAMWPNTDLACVFGYNYPPGGLLPTVLDGSETYSRRFLRDGPSILWVYLGECKSHRLWRFKWTGTPLAPIGFGELVFTQTTRIARANAPGGVAPQRDMEIETAFLQERAVAPSGALYVSPNGGADGSRRARMSFMLTAESELTRLRDEVFGSSRGGLHPSILVGPTAIGKNHCMFGRFEDRLPQSFPGGPGIVYAKVELGFQEDVFPYYAAPVLGAVGA